MYFSTKSSVFMSLTLLSSIAQAKWKIDTKTCGDASSKIHKTVAEEMGKAHTMALKAENLLTTTGRSYYHKMMPSDATSVAGWDDKTKHVFKNSADLLSEQAGTLAGGKTWTITCDDAAEDCEDGADAHSIRATHTINLCGQFFSDEGSDDDRMLATSVLEGRGKVAALTTDDLDVSRAMTLVHETTHFPEVMEPALGSMPPDNRRAVDITYGWENSALLALGKLSVEASPPSSPGTDSSTTGQGKVHLALEAIHNADSWALIAGATYFSDVCGKAVVVSGTSGAASKREHPRALLTSPAA